MNIRPVSFSSTVPANTLSFNERIKKPQTYTTAETPAAASGLGKEDKKKKSPAAKIIGTLITLGAAAAGVAYAAKTGKLAQGTNETLNKIKEPLEKAGNFIAKQAETGKNFVVEKFSSISQKVSQ